MEEEVLRAQACDESIGDVARGAWIWIKWHEAGQGLSILHAWHATALQFLLAKQGANLSLIDDSTFGPSLYHGRDQILREALDEAHWDAVFDHF